MDCFNIRKPIVCHSSERSNGNTALRKSDLGHPYRALVATQLRSCHRRRNFSPAKIDSMARRTTTGRATVLGVRFVIHQRSGYQFALPAEASGTVACQLPRR